MPKHSWTYEPIDKVSHVSEITTGEDLQKTFDANRIVLADYYTPWCVPCQNLAPTFEKLADKFAKEGEVAFIRMDVDSEGILPHAKETTIKMVPTFRIFKNGEMTEEIRGVIDFKKRLPEWEKMLESEVGAST